MPRSLPESAEGVVPLRPAPSSGRGGAGALPLGLLAWVVGIALGTTWFPLADAEAGIQLAIRTSPTDVAVNLLLLAPLAAIVAASARPAAPARATTLRAVGAAAAVSVAIELVQLGVPGRYVEPFDVVLNVAGAALAARAVVALRSLGWRRARLHAAVGGSVLLGVAFVLGATGAMASRLLRMDLWDPAFPVLAGDEATGGRAYAGSVGEARVCAGEGSGRLCIGPGADLASRDRLTDEAERSQRLEITAVVTPSSDTQVGPARIVTFSRDPVFRNMTLGQEGRSLVLRVRTPLAGKNGSDVAFYLPRALDRGAEARLTARYGPSGATLRSEADQGVREGTYPTGALVGWRWLREGHLRPRDLWAAALLGAFALCTPIGLALGRGTGLSRPALVGVAAVGASAVYAGFELLVGSGVDPRHLSMVVVAASGGALLGRWDRRRVGDDSAAGLGSRPPNAREAHGGGRDAG